MTIGQSAVRTGKTLEKEITVKVINLCLIGLAGSVLGSCTAQDVKPEAGLRSESALTRHAKSGQVAKLYKAYQVSVDCLMFGAPPAVKIVKPPQHGTATIVYTQAHTGYPASNPRYKCNSKMTPITGVAYQSQPGFVGTDKLTLHTDFHESFDNPSEDVEVTIKVEP